MTPRRSNQLTFVRSFFLNIILPTLIAITLFIISIFFILIPSTEKNLLERKREMIQELTNSAWNVLYAYDQKITTGELTLEQAQLEAISVIHSLRYGSENKDYFWITDMQPRMIDHPYRTELNGQDLSDFRDSHGKKLFVEFVKTIEENGSGFVDYMWQWKDDSTHIVPKLSYVRGFQAWNWIIGTGIYIQDVRYEISRITSNLFRLSLAIIFFISVILFYIARQSLKIEREKQLAERNLAESREKYKKLVEASEEITFMVLEGTIIFANQPLLKTLDYSMDEILQLDLDQLITGETLFTELLKTSDNPVQQEAHLVHKSGNVVDVNVTISPMEMMDKKGHIIIAADASQQRQIQKELGDSKARFQTLVNSINIGVFRIELGSKPRFVELNQAALKIFGISPDSKDKLYVADFLGDDSSQVINTLQNSGSIRERIVKISRHDQSSAIVSVSAIVVKNDKEEALFIDGIVEDVSEQKQTEKEHEKIISELQASLVYLNQPVKNFAQDCPQLLIETSIKSAAETLDTQNASAGLVVTTDKTPIGIVTADDLWKRVICNDMEKTRSVTEIMTAPIISLPENALLFEALLLMQEKVIRHIPLVNSSGHIQGMITNKEIIHLQQFSAGLLVQEINKEKTVTGLINRAKLLPQIIKYFVDSGFNAQTITHIISNVTDSIGKKIIQFALNEVGEPPVKFAFLVLGSQGREEQTLVTDQDNVLVYENTDKDVQPYFLKFAELVTGWLNDAGYQFCKGDTMAKNPKWCASLDQWKQHFTHWIKEAGPQDLIDISIFFDFRLLYGDLELVQELSNHISKTTENQSGFFNHLAKNALNVKPPISFMGNIVVKSTDEQVESFDIKKALMPLIDFARLYTLKHNMKATNTIQRLEALTANNHLNENTLDEMVESYNYLMSLRFKHQTRDFADNKELDNFINPKKLTQIEQHTLKKIFSQISGFQKKLSFDFTGVAQ